MTEAEWERGRNPRELGRAGVSLAPSHCKARLLAIRYLEYVREIGRYPIDAKALAVAVQVADGLVEDSVRATAYHSYVDNSLSERINADHSYVDDTDPIVYETRSLHHAVLNWSGIQAGLKVLYEICQPLKSRRKMHKADEKPLCSFVRDIFGNPFRPVVFSPEWRTSTAVAIANSMYESRDFGPMPLLADALQDAGCDETDIIDHCRGSGPHCRGCWVVDGVLGKA